MCRLHYHAFPPLLFNRFLHRYLDDVDLYRVPPARRGLSVAPLRIGGGTCMDPCEDTAPPKQPTGIFSPVPTRQTYYD